MSCIHSAIKRNDTIQQLTMKKFKATFLIAAMLVMTPAMLAAPDITDLLKGAAGALKGNGNGEGSNSTALSGIQGLVEGLISKSNLTEEDLVGDWQYAAPAVAFQSDNLLQKAGGAAAAGVIEEKLTPYYAKVGITNLTASFSADKTFKFKINRITLTGTFEKDTNSETGDFIFTFKAGGKLPLGNFKTHVEKVGNSKLSLTFDASKLISLVNTIASVSGRSSLKTVATMLNSYDGLNCGFELSKIQ